MKFGIPDHVFTFRKSKWIKKLEQIGLDENSPDEPDADPNDKLVRMCQ